MTVESGGTSPALLLGALIGLIALAVLVFILTFAYLRSRDGKQRGAGKPKRAGPRETRRRPGVREKAGGTAPAERSAIAPASAARRGEVMRVLRDPSGGRVLVEVDGRRYEHLREIEDAQVGRRVLWAIADLVRFTGGMATNPRVVRNASEGVAWQEDLAKSALKEPSPWTPTTPALADAGADGNSPTSLGRAIREFFQRGQSPAPSSGITPAWFIDQIEVILQAKLKALDVPLPYEVHVSAGPDQRLQIRIGDELYGSVDEVPDPRNRALIQAAVEEWEKR